MKLRIKGNSIRLRLGRSEVSRLASGDVVEESTSFDPAGMQRLTYRIVSDAEVSDVLATFESACLMVRIPADLATDWASTDQIGIEANQASANGSILRILIEKDLECIDAPPEESQADAYPRSGHGPACSSTDGEPVESITIRGL